MEKYLKIHSSSDFGYVSYNFYASIFITIQLENTFLIELFKHANTFKVLRPVLSSSMIFEHEYVLCWN